MSGVTFTPAPPLAARQKLNVVGLVGSVLLVTWLLGPAGLLVPFACLGALIYAVARKSWRPLGLTPLDTRKLWAWLMVATFMVAALALNRAGQREQVAKAQHIVALGRSDPKAQAALLASTDDGTLDRLREIAPALAAGERDRRAARDAAALAASQAAAKAENARIERANAARIADALARQKALAHADLDGRLAVAKELVDLAPARSDFADRLADLQKQRDRRDELAVHPERGLELVDYHWSKDGFGTIMMLDLTVRNVAAVPLIRSLV